MKNKNEFFALSTYNGFLPSWYKKPTYPFWDGICFFAFPQAIRVSQAFSGYQPSATTWAQCPWSCWWRSLTWRFKQGGLGELRGGFCLLSIRNRQKSGFVSDSWWNIEPWDCHVLSLLCFKRSVCCFWAFILKSSVEQEKIRKHTKMNSEVLVKTKHFNPGKEGGNLSSSNTFSWTHFQNY